VARPDRQALSGPIAAAPSEVAAAGAADVASPVPSVAVAYGSTFGTTEEVARHVAARLGARLGREPALLDVGWTDAATIAGHDVLVLGSSTWDVGHLQADWEARVDELAGRDLRGRRVAVFGCGDARGYPDTFGDALGILRERLRAAGAEPFGEVPMRDLGLDPGTFAATLAREGDHLVGLLLDDDEDDERRAAATDAWCDRLARELLAGGRPTDPTTDARTDATGDRASGGDATAGDAASFDDVRVSTLLAASDEVLPLLIRYGFEPLRNQALRTALAPTVTLAQALRLRGLEGARAAELRRDLADVLAGAPTCR
jgi:flavodoxin I